MTPRPSTHALTLTSSFLVKELKGSPHEYTQVYRAACSCNEWSTQDKPANEIRALHVAHLQDALGPDREAKT